MISDCLVSFKQQNACNGEFCFEYFVLMTEIEIDLLSILYSISSAENVQPAIAIVTVIGYNMCSNDNTQIV